MKLDSYIYDYIWLHIVPQLTEYIHVALYELVGTYLTMHIHMHTHVIGSLVTYP